MSDYIDETLLLVPLVEVKAHNVALLFTNYLVTQNIKTEVKEGNDGFIIFCSEENLVKAKTEFELFIQQPYAPQYQKAAWDNAEVVNVRNNEATLFDSFKESFFGHAGIVTLSVFSLCWIVFIATNLGWGLSIFNSVKFYSQLSLDAFLAQPLRILGPAFFHFSLLHIVFNTMWWWQLGGSIEKILGKGTLVNILLLSAIASNLGQYLVSGSNFGGLSGVVYALVGFVWWYGYLVPEKGLTLSKPIVGFLLFWLVLGFADLLPVNVANTAHLLGLLSGCFLAVFTVKVLNKEREH
jgi:GlpG protein